MTKDLIIELVTKGYNWLDLGPQKNPYILVSFKNEDDVRMNIYTTFTVQIQQGYGKYNNKKHVYREIDTLEKLEDILISFK